MAVLTFRYKTETVEVDGVSNEYFVFCACGCLGENCLEYSGEVPDGFPFDVDIRCYKLMTDANSGAKYIELDETRKALLEALALEEDNANRHVIRSELSNEVEALSDMDEELNTRITDNELDIIDLDSRIVDTNDLIQDLKSGTVNMFMTSGGNNIFRNTDLAEENSRGLVEWDGELNKQDNINAVNGISILLGDGIATQTQTVPNGEYILGFNYNKLIDVATASIKINGTEYELGESGVFEQSFEVVTNSITIEFISDVADSYEIYDLRGNVGTVLLPYSQHPNEIRSKRVVIGDGITIKSDTQNTINILDADGQKLINATTKEVVQQTTDEGGWFKKIIVIEDSEITGLSIIKAGEQVHINGV